MSHLLSQAAVARELAKQVYVAEKLSPPSLTEVRYACEPTPPLSLAHSNMC